MSSRRYLIVGTGRSGSSLLCKVLMDAGADFALSERTELDRREGSHEHPSLDRAHRWKHRSRKLKQSLIPFGMSYCRGKMREALRAALEEAIYLKSPRLVWMVQDVYQLGYQPRIIVSYRRFEEYCVSRFLKHGYSLDRLEDTYAEINRTALLQLRIFGGCAVGYGELTNTDETDWAEALGRLTGLDRKELLEHRDQTLEPRRLRSIDVPTGSRIETCYRELRSLKGQVLDSSFLDREHTESARGTE